jgi:methylenetetrahydrofolate reductase (NADPH)
MPTDRPADPRLAVSVEMTPVQVLGMAGLDSAFPAGTRVYLTDLGSDGDDRFAGAAVVLGAAGYVPVPHIAARRLTGQAALEARLGALCGAGSVTDVLVIAGSVARPAGPYASTLDVLRTGLLEAGGIRRIGVAGHPEGSPDIPPDELPRALAEKNDYAAASPAEFHIVTQFGFDPTAIVAWCEAAGRAGNALPIHIGLAGPARVATLIKYAATCGVGASISMLMRRAGALAALATSYSPEAVAEPVERWCAENPGGPITHLHVFPFGGVAKTADWLYDRGSWRRGEELANESGAGDGREISR